MIISRETQLEFVRQLLVCSSIKDKNQREVVLDLLPMEVKQRIPREKTDFTDVLRIIETCSNFEEGVEQLVWAVHEVEGETEEWHQLEKLVRKKIPKVVSYTECQLLLSIAKEIDWPEDVLKKAYLASIPEFWTRLHFDAGSSTLMLMLKDMATIGCQEDQTFPVLAFVERCICTLSARVVYRT